jgi:hypothetical protein
MTLSFGTETTVNTKTAGRQSGSTITTLSDGRWVVTWITSTGDVADRGVRSQVFNADGSMSGSEIAVYTSLSQVGVASTTALADGGWLVTYEYDQQDLGIYTPDYLRQQRYNSDGTPTGAPGATDLANYEDQGHASVEKLPDGGWLMVWQDVPIGQSDISLQRYNSSGLKVGGKVTVNTETYRTQETPDIAVLANGGWVVTYASDPYSKVLAQLFNADGTKNGNEFQVDWKPFEESSITASEVTALAGGGFVVSWTQGRDDANVYFRQYNADGTAVSEVTQANPTDSTDQRDASITALDTGGFVITWQSGDYSEDIYCQAFNADGSKNGEPVLVNTTMFADQIEASVTALAGGGWVVTWTNEASDGDKNIMQKVFHLVNDAPSGTDKTIDLVENTRHDFTVADFGFNDINNNELAQITITEAPGNGALTLNGVTVTVGASLSVADIAELVWTPAENTSGDGLATVSFTVKDDGGTANGGADQDQSANTITFNVGHVNRAPTGADATLTILEDHSYIFAASDFGFSDGSDETVINTLHKVIITGFEVSGTLTLDGAEVTAGQVINATDLEKLVYTPLADGHGTGGLTLQFKVVDNGGTANGGVDTDPTANILTIDVTSVDDAPTGADARLTIDVADTYTFSTADFGFSDRDDNPANGLTQVIVDSISGSGAFMLGDTAVSAGAFIDVDDIGSLTFTANAGETGQNYASLVFRLVDDGGTENGGENTQANASTITFDVAQINDAPTGADARILIREDSQFLFSADRFGFSDPDDDPSNALSQVVIRSIGGQGAFMLDDRAVYIFDRIDIADIGRLTFTGDADGFGKNYASLGFSVIDDGGAANGGSDRETTTHTITFDVLSVADMPLGSNARLTIKEDASYTFSAASFGFSDPVDGHVLSKVIIDKFNGDGDLLLSGKAVRAGQAIKAADLGKLTFTGGDDDFGQGYASIKFRVVDNGSTANGGVNTDLTANTLVFDLSDVTDKVTGKAGKDKLVGTIGRDILDGKAGNDTLAGKAGSDTFVFKNGYDKDVITDFRAAGAAHDILDIRSLTAITSLNDLLINHLSETKAGIVIDGLHGDVITLKGVDMDDLSAADFLI